LPEPKAQRQQAVHDLLHGLKGIEPLKKLFWSELNYDRVNQPLSRRGWKESVAGLLADDPILFASGADAFHVIYLRLASDKLLIGDERPVVARLLQEHPYALFVFSNSRQENFHFLNVKYDDDTQKRRLFRRITVGPFEQLRTASERITLLDLADVSQDLFGLSPLAIQERHDQAFDVEPVTKEFFHEYRRIFEEVEEAITGFGRDKDRKRLYTQRLFNRLMFIAFIQKKGWLKYNGDADYLAALWKAHLKDDSVSDKNFYRDRLKRLFFDGLNTTNEVNRIGINRGGFLKTLIGDVPYLNGGLFEDDEDDNDENIKVPDKATGSILKSLFAKFNFTVTESTPLDVEVAVDPEMLGRIFEELVTGRHESGSYYTPKPIVSFMCREALKGYLGTNAASESKEAIERFVENHEPDDLGNAESVLDALRRVKVCDPACGSGAYLLGMLHELLDLRAALFQSRRLDSLSVYQRKLEIIQTNVYGVDIDQFAVNIARLRLWLSLAVDFEGAKPEPLPNLDYKVEVGDSLAAPSPSGGGNAGLRQALIDEFLVAKAGFLVAHHGHKRELKSQIEQIKEQLAAWAHDRSVAGFDWAVEFAEVFAEGGFDVVVANPPYVSAIEFSRRYPKPYRGHLTGNFQTAQGAWDLYVLFFERGLTLMKKGGMLAFITPNKYLSARYAVALREFLLEHSHLIKLVDLSSVPVFATVMVYPVLTFLRQEEDCNSGITQTLTPTQRGDDDPSSYCRSSFDTSMLRLLPENIWGFLLSDSADLLAKLLTGGQPLANYGEINATSTAAEADAFTPHIKDTKPRGGLKLVNTGTIDPLQSLWGKFALTHAGRKLVTPWLDVTAAQVNERRLLMYRTPKIIFAKMAARCECLVDWEGKYASVNTNCFYKPIDPVDLDYVAAFCSSSVFMFLYRQFFGALRMSGGYFQFQSPQLRVIPLRNTTSAKKRQISEILARVKNNEVTEQICEEVIQKINDLFCRIYEVSADERSILEAE
jgi:type I restriction-modification system DNA methylase subunit